MIILLMFIRQVKILPWSILMNLSFIDTEKFLRILELINPDIEPSEVCKVEEVQDEEEEELYPGMLDQHRVSYFIN